MEMNYCEGIDVSGFQTSVNWGKVAETKKFVYLKATEGETLVDKKFINHADNSKKEGLYRGAYHFFHPSDDPVKQAHFFLNTVIKEDLELPPVLDVEVVDHIKPKDIMENTNKFLDAVMGIYPLVAVYTASWFWNNNLTFQSMNASLWVATWVGLPNIPRGWDRWLFWQYLGNGSIPGGVGSCDLDRFNGTWEDLQNFVKTGNYAPPHAGPETFRLDTILGKQRALNWVNSNGLRSVSLDLLVEDGIFGPKTLKAYEKFQKDNNLRVTGVWDHNTENKMVEMLRVK